MGKFNRSRKNVFKLRGQSNMDGNHNTAAPPAYHGAQSVECYFKTDRTSTDNGSWQPLEAGVNNLDPTRLPTDDFSIEIQFPKNLNDTTGIDCNVIKTAKGGTNITTHLSGNAEGVIDEDYYTEPALCKMAKDGIIDVKVIWFQGFQDCLNDIDPPLYAGKLDTLQSDVRTHLRNLNTGQHDIYFLVLESPDFTGGTTTEARVNTVQASQLAFGDGRYNRSIPKPASEDFADEGIHLTGASLIVRADGVLVELLPIVLYETLKTAA